MANAEYAFKTIVISGQSNVVADSHEDTLTLAGVGNLAVTTNAATDTITLTLSSTALNDHSDVVIAGLATGDVLWYNGSNWVDDTPNTAGLVALTGAQTIAGVKTFSSIPVLPASNPTAANQAVRKAYVDGGSQGFIVLEPQGYSGTTQGTWAVSHHANNDFYVHSENTTTADGDQVDFKADLSAGTYTIIFFTEKDNDCGIVDIDIGGTTYATFDLYDAALQINQRLTDTGNVIATGGLVTISIKLDGQHGSSSDYRCRWQRLVLFRTA